jgi:NAD(P)-dependent dehydrogenase (short-subunit alcohol dehydrogenase family)
MSQLENRVTVVTGAGSGMGKAIVDEFLSEGAKVIGFSLEDSMNLVNDNFTYVSGDIRSLSDCEKTIEVAVKKYGKIDSLVHCAGITREGTLETTSVDEFKLTMDINVLGTFNINKAAIKFLKLQPSTIVNISSNMAVKALNERIAYNPSKAAVNMLTECIAKDYAPNVRANTIMPGIVDTPMIEKRFNEAENPEELKKLYSSFYLLDRIGSVEDIVKAALFLTTDESSWMTGGHLPICGGDQI